MGADGRDEVAGTVGLGEVAVHAGVVAPANLVLHRMGGEGDHRGAAAGGICRLQSAQPA